MKVEEVNDLLKLSCKKDGLGFIDNSNIPSRLLVNCLHLKNSANDNCQVSRGLNCGLSESTVYVEACNIPPIVLGSTFIHLRHLLKKMI